VHIIRFSQACYMPCSSHLPSLGLLNNVCWQLQVSPFSSVSLCSFLGATNHVCLITLLCIVLRHAVRRLQQGVLYLQTACHTAAQYTREFALIYDRTKSTAILYADNHDTHKRSTQRYVHISHRTEPKSGRKFASWDGNSFAPYVKCGLSLRRFVQIL
jgi:hypothetical protein